ncbi:hypothetical protein PINS_up018263 [Pythium insidiosum]|nr:hypothetical protein PINS_up018263 [Pythium insidiosum]
MDLETKTQAQLANSTSAIIKNNREGIALLAQRYKASCETADASMREFRDAAGKQQRTDHDISIVGPQTIDLLTKLIDKSRDAFSAAWTTYIWRSVFLFVRTAVDVRARGQRGNLVGDAAEIDDLSVQISQHVAAQSRLRSVADKLKKVAGDLKALGNELAGNGPSPELWRLFNSLVTSSTSPANIAAFRD